MSNKLWNFKRSSIHSVNNWTLTLIIYPFFRWERQYLKYCINPLLGKGNFFKSLYYRETWTGSTLSSRRAPWRTIIIFPPPGIESGSPASHAGTLPKELSRQLRWQFGTLHYWSFFRTRTCVMFSPCWYNWWTIIRPALSQPSIPR